MFDLDKLSYRAYGNLVIGTLIVIALLLNLFPLSLFELIVCVIQIPIYLITRASFKKPIHARGLNICFVLTILFYTLLFLCIKGMYRLIAEPLVVVFSLFLTILSCYITSTLPNLIEEKGKLFFGYKKHNESKYDKLIEYIKYNGLSPELLDAEERLKNTDAKVYLIYKRKFRDDKTFKEINEEFEIENGRIVEILDKAYFYIIGALKI